MLMKCFIINMTAILCKNDFTKCLMGCIGSTHAQLNVKKKKKKILIGKKKKKKKKKF